MARIKKVNPVEQVAHLWANKAQSDARNACGNFYFEGDVIFSYGRHFPIARHVTTKQKAPAVLFTTAGYSSTTNGHKACVRQALHGSPVKVFYVPLVGAHVAPGVIDHKSNFKAYGAQALEAMKKSIKARSGKSGYIAAAAHFTSEANEYAKAFGLRCRMDESKLPGMVQEAQALEAKEARKESKRRAELEAKDKAAREQAARGFPSFLATWQDTGTVPVNGTDSHVYHYLEEALRDTVYFRLARDGATVQTSRGAEVPARAARRLFRALYNMRVDAMALDSGADYVAYSAKIAATFHGLEVGAFKVDSVDINGNFVAGCHTVQWVNVEQFARLVGWMDSNGRMTDAAQSSASLKATQEEESTPA